MWFFFLARFHKNISLVRDKEEKYARNIPWAEKNGPLASIIWPQCKQHTLLKILFILTSILTVSGGQIWNHQFVPYLEILVQNQLSDKGNCNIKSKLTQKLYDENIWLVNITKPIIFQFFTHIALLLLKFYCFTSPFEDPLQPVTARGAPCLHITPFVTLRPQFTRYSKQISEISSCFKFLQSIKKNKKKKHIRDIGILFLYNHNRRITLDSSDFLLKST